MRNCLPMDTPREKLFYRKCGRPLRIIYPVSEGFDFRRARFNQILQTSHALACQGCEVELLIGKNQTDILREALPYFGLERHQNLRVHPIRMLRMEERKLIRFSWNGVFFLNCLIKIRRLIRDHSCDALYVRHLELANFLLDWQGYFGLPVIFEVHELFHVTTERKENVRRIWLREKRLYDRVNGVIAITRGLADKIQEVFGVSNRMAVIPDGVGQAFFQKPLPRPSNRKIIYVGQLYPWKGIGVLMEALSHLPEGCLHIVGGSQESLEKWRKRSAEMRVQDRIVFHGQVSPQVVRTHLREAAVAVLPLTQDPISALFTSPLKLFEYMAAGIPIVASDLPSTREILTPEVNAILVPANDPNALANGIRRLFEDRGLAERIGQKGAQDADQFTWQRRGERIVRFLRSLEMEGGAASSEKAGQRTRKFRPASKGEILNDLK
jgi:glycosyltransferase involved in cell wall biosynthesis